MRSNKIVLVGGVFDACRSFGLPLAGSFGLPLAGSAPRAARSSGGARVPMLLALVFAVLMVAAMFAHSHALVTVAALKLGGLALLGETEHVSNDIADKRERLNARQEEMAALLKMANDGAGKFNMSRPALLKRLGAADANDAIGKMKEIETELAELSTDLRNAEGKAMAERNRNLVHLRDEPAGDPYRRPSEVSRKSFGELFVSSKSFIEGHAQRRPASVTVDIGLKTLLETTAGWAPESLRNGDVVMAASRPPQLVDFIPVRPTQYELVRYMEQTTRTQSAAEKAEGTAYAESAFVFTQRESPVRKITTSLPITDEQLQDVGEVQSVIDSELRLDIRTRLDQQIWDGDGSAPNLAGFFDYNSAAHANGDIQTLAQNAGGVGDSIFDAVFSAMTAVRTTGRANPNLVVLHPTDWAIVRLARTDLGEFLMGNPSQPGVATLFGAPVVQMEAGSAGTGLVGDFANYCYIAERRGIDVQSGYVDDQFKTGIKTIRADVRVAFVLRRPAAFCAMTGLAAPS